MASFLDSLIPLLGTAGKAGLLALENQRAEAGNKLALELARIAADTTKTSSEYALAVAKAKSDHEEKLAKLDDAKKKKLYTVVGIVATVVVLGAVLITVTVVRLKQRPPAWNQTSRALPS